MGNQLTKYHEQTPWQRRPSVKLFDDLCIRGECRCHFVCAHCNAFRETAGRHMGACFECYLDTLTAEQKRMLREALREL